MTRPASGRPDDGVSRKGAASGAARLADRIARLHPFKSRDARNLAVLFGVVYFAQGMWNLPTQALTVALKEEFALSAGQVATFFSLSSLPWLLKPAYGLLSDFVPLFGRRRKSYFLLASMVGSAAGLSIALMGTPSYWQLAGLLTAMALGLAFTDVLTDALMVEHGRPRGLTGAFQAVQWAAVSGAAILVGMAGGRLAHTRSFRTAVALEAMFPLVALAMAVWCVKETPTRADRKAFADTWMAIRGAVSERDLWIVAGFIFFWTFSPSIGTALFYYQTDVLKFPQQSIGNLRSVWSAAAVVGALIYAPLSRRVPLRQLINLAIAIGVAGTLAYLAYRDLPSAIIIDVVFGCANMITFLAFLDLAARACPRRIEGTFFALLMAVYNAGTQASHVVGGYLYDFLGYGPLVLISAATSALTWALVPMVRIDRIEAKAREEADGGTRFSTSPPSGGRDDSAVPPGASGVPT